MSHDAAKQLAVFWHLMNWKTTLWLHSTMPHSSRFLRESGSMYLFSSASTERWKSPFCHLQKCFWGLVHAEWSDKQKGIAHVVDMYALDESLKGV